VSGVAGMRRGRGLPDAYLEPCGTLAAYRRHLRRGDPVDESCRQAVVRDWQDRAAVGRARIPAVHLDGPGRCYRRDVIVTGAPERVTCRTCLSGYRRLPWVRAAARGRSRAA
jgi:hypothetical protein